jgi:exo beta-1,2-glucooligosaccharide sophorohydrolase (non-reducing end)
MKKILFIIFVFLSVWSTAQEYDYTYTFFINSAMPGNWFLSGVKSEGGSTIKSIGGKLPVDDEIYHSPGNSLRLQYENVAGGSWQAAVFCKALRGMDHFKKAEALSFWLYYPSGYMPAKELPHLQLMFPDSSLSAIIEIPSIKPGQWQRVIIPGLSRFSVDPGHPENIIAVVFTQNQNANDIEYILYLDDMEFIELIKTSPVEQIPVIVSARGYDRHVDIAWEKITDPGVHLVNIYRSYDGKVYNWIGVQQPYYNRYADFTDETGKDYSYRISFMNGDYEESGWSEPATASTRPMNDDELLTMVQEASFRYYWEGVEPNSGMARENIPGRQNMVATGASGFGIMALLVGTERKFITRDESVERFLKILNFLERADRFHGAYGHFMDGPTGRVEPFFGNEDNGADLVETAFLMEGLLAARQYFSQDTENEKLIREKITAVWNAVEWDWFRKEPRGDFLFWHWSPDQEWVINHRLIGWNETMVVYLLAIASPTHSVPAEMYYSGWASQDKLAQKYRMNWGGSEEGSMYTNGHMYSGIKLDVGVNNGGPLFFTHYSYMGYDPHFITDKYTNYFNNNRSIAKINYNYCISNPHNFKGYGEGGWGLTASDGPYEYSADEPMPSRDNGKLAPTGAISSFPYTPAESMNALKNYYYDQGSFLWGEYGFKDAYNLTQNWCSEIYMGLNQAPMVVMIENYRTGLIWKLFMMNPEVQEGLRKIEK